MPINVTGTTDTTGAISVLPSSAKSVCVLGKVGRTDPALTTPLKVFDVIGTADAVVKWGADAVAVGIVEKLINRGVSSIKGIVVPEVVEPATEASVYTSALAALLTVKNADILLLDVTTQTVWLEVRDHLDEAEAEDIFRYAVLAGSGDNASLGVLAGAINHKRIFVAGPGLLNKDAITASDSALVAAGVAAAIAVESADPALPMNGVELYGFGGVGRALLKAEVDTLINSGVTPLYQAPTGRPAIYRLVSSYTQDSQAQPDTIWQEGTTVFIADDVLKACQSRIRANYKRTKQVARILDAMRTDIIDVLQKKQDMEIIENFDKTTVTIMKDPTDAYGALIDYTFDVVLPLYTVTIRQHMKL